MNRGGGTLAPPGPPSGPGSACAGAPGETGCGPLPAREGVRGDGLNPSAAQAEVIVDELIRNEVRHVVLSPGSRNAPLSFALHAADAAGRLRRMGYTDVTDLGGICNYRGKVVK